MNALIYITAPILPTSYSLFSSAEVSGDHLQSILRWATAVVIHGSPLHSVLRPGTLFLFDFCVVLLCAFPLYPSTIVPIGRFVNCVRVCVQLPMRSDFAREKEKPLVLLQPRPMHGHAVHTIMAMREIRNHTHTASHNTPAPNSTHLYKRTLDSVIIVRDRKGGKDGNCAEDLKYGTSHEPLHLHPGTLKQRQPPPSSGKSWMVLE